MNNSAKLRHAIDHLSLAELKQALILIMSQADAAHHNSQLQAALWDSLQELNDELLTTHNKQREWEPISTTSTVHVVFGSSFSGSLKFAIKSMGVADKHKVITLNENYAIAPLRELHYSSGNVTRYRWLFDHLNDPSYDYTLVEDIEMEHLELQRQITQIPAHAVIIIWIGNNASEQTGLRYASFLLRHLHNEIILFNPSEACATKFNLPDQFIDYLHSGEIPSDKLQSIFPDLENSKPITNESRRILEQEWLELSKQDEVLRIWVNGQIQQVNKSYFDSYLLSIVEQLHHTQAHKEFITAARIIGEAMGCCDQYVGGLYFEYRLRELIYQGELKIKGVPRAMRTYSVRRR